MVILLVDNPQADCRLVIAVSKQVILSVPIWADVNIGRTNKGKVKNDTNDFIFIFFYIFYIFFIFWFKDYSSKDRSDEGSDE